MLENLIIILFDIGLFIFYTLVGFIGALLLQLISYKVFKFNLYKFLKYILIDKEMER